MKLSLLIDDASAIGQDPDHGRDREDRIVELLKNIGDVEALPGQRIEAVKHCLRDTSSDVVRNQAALTLVDLIAREAAPDIIRALRSKDIPGSSGTLLFALNEIEAEFPLDILARTVAVGSYEAQNEAMFALEQSRVAPADDETEERVVAEVTPLLHSDDAATAEVAGSLLAHIRVRRSGHPIV